MVGGSPLTVGTVADVAPVVKAARVTATGDAASLGAWVARGLQQHARTPYGSRGVASMVATARLAWRLALADTSVGGGATS